MDSRLWFDGVFAGLYRTDDRLRILARDDRAAHFAAEAEPPR